MVASDSTERLIDAFVNSLDLSEYDVKGAAWEYEGYQRIMEESGQL